MNMRLSDVLNLLVACGLARATSRAKRIIDGIPLPSRTSGYSAVRYYVWISNGAECTLKPPGWLSSILGLEEDDRLDYGWLGFRCAPDPTNIQCGGSLITPRIVQTACHCLAYFEWSSDEEKIRRAVLETHYEAKYKVYLGINQVKHFTIGMPTSKHFVHQKCSQMPDAYTRRPVVWDYGWMLLQFSVENWGDFPLHWIDYAPQYTRDELLKIWDDTHHTQAVCLMLGFGGARRVLPEEPYEEPSEILRHAWVYTEQYMKCKNYSDWFEPERRNELRYTDDATWGCGVPFTEEVRTFGDGDSGGPATCNNHYVGVNSQTLRIRFRKFGKNRTSIPLYVGTRFALLENAIEYRKTFMEHIGHYAEFTKNGRNQPFLTLRPPWRFTQTAEAKASVRSYLNAARLDRAVRFLLVAHSSILVQISSNMPWRDSEFP